MESTSIMEPGYQSSYHIDQDHVIVRYISHSRTKINSAQTSHNVEKKSSSASNVKLVDSCADSKTEILI